MVQSGAITAQVLRETLKMAAPGMSTWELDAFATRRICELGGEPGFKKVAGYDFATCININEGLVHGVPSRRKILREGDVVSIDLGTFYRGFHTDAAWTVMVGLGVLDVRVDRFLAAGKKALKNAIARCHEGGYVGDVSHTIQESIEGAGFSVVRALVGHGVGRKLHEPPQIPCFGRARSGSRLVRGMVLAIEVLYARGDSEIEILDDGWTIVTRDGSLAAIFEETVAVGKKEGRVLTPIG